MQGKSTCDCRALPAHARFIGARAAPDNSFKRTAGQGRSYSTRGCGVSNGHLAKTQKIASSRNGFKRDLDTGTQGGSELRVRHSRFLAKVSGPGRDAPG